jgi:dephospho-CoA kinase
MVIGITGSFGSGKSTVAGMFKGLGAYVIDADTVCHSLMVQGCKVYKKTIRCFGRGVLKKNGTLDRRKLAEIVFADKSKLKQLNGIVHPEAIKEILGTIRRLKIKTTVVVDAALLFETGFYKNMDKVIAVKTDMKNQIERIKKSKGMDEDEIVKRIRSQSSLTKKLAIADYIIDNNKSVKQTKLQVKTIWKQLEVKNGGKSEVGH